MAYDKNHFVISIHAPTRGATSVGSQEDLSAAISIHAPTRGATRIPATSQYFERFQSTLPRGERRAYPKSRLGGYYISIHAPTRGATELRYFGDTPPVHFNPRSHEGSDSRRILQGGRSGISIHAPTRGATVLSVVLIVGELFQSTLPRGERLSKT